MIICCLLATMLVMAASLSIYLCFTQQRLLKQRLGSIGLWCGGLLFSLSWGVLAYAKSPMTALFMVALLGMIVWSLGPLCLATIQHTLARYKDSKQ